MKVNINKYLLLVLILVGGAGIIYGYIATTSLENAKQIKTNQDYIIKTLNDSENQRQKNKIAILNNMTAEIKEVKADAHANRLALEKILLHQNLTVTFPDINGTHHPNATGRISGFDKPVIIQ